MLNSITGTYFDIKLSKFGLEGLPKLAIMDFLMPISQLFEELQVTQKNKK